MSSICWTCKKVHLVYTWYLVRVYTWHLVPVHGTLFTAVLIVLLGVLVYLDLAMSSVVRGTWYKIPG